MFGGFAGVYFAQVLVTGTALVGSVAAAFGSASAGDPLRWGLIALAAYTLGIIGGSLGLQRPRAAALLMFIGAIGGLVATYAVVSAVVGPLQQSPAAATRAPARTAAPFSVTPLASLDNGTSALVAAPFVGPALLLLGALLAFAARSDDASRGPDRGELTRTGNRRFVPRGSLPDRQERPPSPAAPPSSGHVSVDVAENVSARALDDRCPRCQSQMASSDMLCPSCGIRRNRG